MSKKEIIKKFGDNVYYENRYYMCGEIPNNRIVAAVGFVYKGYNVTLTNKDEVDDNLRGYINELIVASNKIPESDYENILSDLELAYNNMSETSDDKETNIFTLLLLTAIKNGLLVSDGDENGICLVTKLK